MAETNGHDTDMPLSPGEYVDFRIGGRDIRVPALTLWDLEQSRDDIRSLSPAMWWTEYASTVLRVIARKLKPDAPPETIVEGWQKACVMGEANQIIPTWNKLMEASGFKLGDDARPLAETSPGIGTSTESPPNSPLPSESSTSPTSNEP